MSAEHPETVLDVFVDDPLGFDAAYMRAVQYELAPGIMARICSLPDLLRLKTAAGWLKDLADIAALKRLHGLP